MEARYLRVKNWHKHQHYKERRPPWIKIQRDLINGDDGRAFREDLTELEQWQLVRIWLYVSGSERVMLVADREVPLMAYDERTIRLGIRSEKRVALDKFVRLGFLEPVSGAEVDASPPASTDASAAASTDASAGSSIDPPESGVVIDPPRVRARERGSEVHKDLSGSNEPGAEIVPLAASGEPRTLETPANGGALVKEAIDGFRSIGTEPTRRVIQHLGAEIKKLLDEGQSPDAIRAGMARMVQRGMVQPSLLGNFVMEAQLPSRPRGGSVERYGRGVTTEAILDMAAAAAEEERREAV